MSEQKQGYDPKRGLRWHAVTTGKTRVVWGHTKVLGVAAGKRVAAENGEEFLRLEPAPPDYRNLPRGGRYTEKLTILVSEEDRKRIRKAYGNPFGSLNANLRQRLLEGLPEWTEADEAEYQASQKKLSQK